MSENKREFLKCGYMEKRVSFIYSSVGSYREELEEKDESMKSKQNSIVLDSIKSVDISKDEDNHGIIMLKIYSFIENIIMVTTKSGEYLFSCDSSSERDLWINAIQAAKANDPLETSSKMVYTRYNHTETIENDNSYFNRLVTKFCESKSSYSYMDSLLCLTAYFARMHPENSNSSSDHEGMLMKCDNMLSTVLKHRESAKRYNRWNESLENLFVDFENVVKHLQERLNDIIVVEKAIALGISEAGNNSPTGSSSMPLPCDIHKNEKEQKSIPKNGLFNNYKMMEKMGSGAFSVVQKAQNVKTNEIVAIKCINKSKLSKSDIDQIKNEVDILAKLDHPNILKLKECYDEENMYYIVTELADGGDLFNKIVEKNCYTEAEARDVIRTVVEAISYCHEHNIVHRDLKPENILLSSSGDIKIADFGFAKSMDIKNRLETDCGTPWYVAPEVLENKLYGTEVDMWSLGVIIYIILGGFPPFHDNNQARLFRKIRSGHYSFISPYFDDISEEAKDLIQHLLVVDPRLRYDAKQVLKHKWLTSTEVRSNAHLCNAQEGLRAFIDVRRKRVLRQGYLMKQGHFIKNWKKRSFVLTVDSLSYYPDETSSVPKGTIELADITVVNDSTKPSNFIIETKSGKSYEIQANDEDEKNNWKSSLLFARRCWLLIERASMALTEERIDDAIEMVSEARRCDGMLLNTKLLNLWSDISLKCEKNNCAAVFNINTFIGSSSLTIYSLTIAKQEDNYYILLGSSNGIIQILNRDGISCGQLSIDEYANITSLSIQHSTNTLISTCSSGKIQFWSFNTKKLLCNKEGHTCPISCCDISRCRNIAVVGTIDGIVKEYDIGDYSLLKERKCNSGSILDIAYNYSSKYVITAGENSELFVMDEMTLNTIEVLKGHTGNINSISINFDDIMLTGGDDKKSILWDLKLLKKKRELTTDELDDKVFDSSGKIVSVSLSNDVKWGITADSNSKIILWNLKTGLPEVLSSIEEKIVSIKCLGNNTGFLCSTNKKVEKWIFDWVLTKKGRDYPPPVWMLLK